MWQSYRSPTSPAPLWEEQALYGGYQWIEFTPEIWVNRKWEAHMHIFNKMQSGKLDCNGKCIQDFMAMLTSKNVFSDKPQLQVLGGVQDILRVTPVTENLKIYNRVKPWDTLAVYGWNESIKNFMGLYSTEFKTILGTTDMPRYPGLSTIARESLNKAAMHQVCIVDSTQLDLKRYVSNWANIVVV